MIHTLITRPRRLLTSLLIVGFWSLSIFCCLYAYSHVYWCKRVCLGQVSRHFSKISLLVFPHYHTFLLSISGHLIFGVIYAILTPKTILFLTVLKFLTLLVSVHRSVLSHIQLVTGCNTSIARCYQPLSTHTVAPNSNTDSSAP